MKTSAFFLAALSAGTLLLSSCGNNQSAETSTTAGTAAAADSAAGAGHSAMHHGAAAPDMMGLMHGMMKNMDNLPAAGNTDHDFAHMMMAHHKGAVEMSALELKEGKDATLRAMAEKINADQQQEILALEEFATRLDGAPANYKPEDPADPFTSQMKASMDGMMTNMGPASGNVDQDYAALMIPHHQSAVEMAKAELAHGRDTKLKQLAQQMITAQEQEIKQFKAWQTKNGGETKPAAAIYECPMGDSAPSNSPGKCPKCGMNLEKKA
ncbi:DUF305 domain-containing protein [Hymenobacter cellulosivorans]|uniref:DUF305 domain-containing protein n=1 Tax=Hymenobacter cellulosivorans TaxID=2932249 RepID=A0ABY4F399_9BACT|nr:DUF305 domain-containing protein [Hymenobacter cellulosivorans]UOQ50735.1 DUF305 domain-containing protein [Hymenobacter cellulosivorans]